MSENKADWTNPPLGPRVFATGATRDTETGKLDYEGFLSPLVLKRFAEFMHSKRHMPDGSYRDSDNWQKGIPKAVYHKSLQRHAMDAWLHSRGYPDLAADPLETTLCAVMFNAMGLLFEILKEKL